MRSLCSASEMLDTELCGMDTNSVDGKCNTVQDAGDDLSENPEHTATDAVPNLSPQLCSRLLCLVFDCSTKCLQLGPYNSHEMDHQSTQVKFKI
jgi:hypothetical protein